MNFKWTDIIPYVAIVSPVVFIVELIALYFATGLYLYKTVTIFSMADWVINYYGIYILAFSISTGVLTGLIRYMSKNSQQTKLAKRLGISGGILSLFSSILFLCCAPYIAGFTILAGTLALTMIRFSKELFISGIVIQLSMIAYLSKKIYDNNITCKCSQ